MEIVHENGCRIWTASYFTLHYRPDVKNTIIRVLIIKLQLFIYPLVICIINIKIYLPQCFVDDVHLKYSSNI